MKRGTPEHPKVKRLMQALEIGRAQAVGHLELLWHFVHDWAPQGNVGKWTDAEIAAACDASPATFVRALTDSGWLETSPEHRLLVHDWHEHCESTTKKYLEYHKLPFLTLRRNSQRIRGNSQKISGLARVTGTGTGHQY